jgi:hypothetical protein
MPTYQTPSNLIIRAYPRDMLFIAAHLRRIARDPKSPSYLQGYYKWVANNLIEAAAGELRPLKLASEYEQEEAFLEDVLINNVDPGRIDPNDETT